MTELRKLEQESEALKRELMVRMSFISAPYSYYMYAYLCKRRNRV